MHQDAPACSLPEAAAHPNDPEAVPLYGNWGAFRFQAERGLAKEYAMEVLKHSALCTSEIHVRHDCKSNVNGSISLVLPSSLYQPLRKLKSNLSTPFQITGRGKQSEKIGNSGQQAAEKKPLSHA
eukprot:352062-Amphidinium_carterae.1